MIKIKPLDKSDYLVFKVPETSNGHQIEVDEVDGLAVADLVYFTAKGYYRQVIEEIAPMYLPILKTRYWIIGKLSSLTGDYKLMMEDALVMSKIDISKPDEIMIILKRF